MGRSAFIRSCRQLTADRFLRATTEAGPLVLPPVAAAANRGQLQLRGGGEVITAASLDLALAAGGNVTGYSTAESGTPGATARWKNRADASTEWRGYTDAAFFTWARLIARAGATVDYPGVGSPKALQNGSIGFARVKRDTVGGNKLEFCYKATRGATWTVVTQSTTGTANEPEPASAPDFIVLASGRLVYFYLTTAYEVRARYSDDNGATWAAWSGNTKILMSGASPRQIAAEVVDDAICIVVSMAPAATAQTAYVGWSNNGGTSFTQAGSLLTWGPTRLCATQTGVVIAATTNQVTNAVAVSRIARNASPSTATGTNLTIGHHATGVSPAIVALDDGVLWVYGSHAISPASILTAACSDDHGVTWRVPLTGASTGAAEVVWNLGINTATPRGIRAFAAGAWQGRIHVLGVTDVSTAARDDSIVELQFGGWETVTERYSTTGRRRTYGDEDVGCFLPVDLLDSLDWTRTNIAAGATVTSVDDGLNFVSTAADNSYYTAPTTYYATTGHNNGVRIKVGFYVTSGGSITDSRSHILVRISDGANRQSVILRLELNQIRLVDGAGTTMGTSAVTVGAFANPTEVLIAFDEGVTATTGTVSAWYRHSAGSGVWTQFVTAATVSEQAIAGAEVQVGGSVAGASDWTLMYGPVLADDDNDLSGGFTNPTDLVGRALASSSTFEVTAGWRLGGAGGAGVQGDAWTWDDGATYSGDWTVRSLSPSRQHRATGDNATHEVVFDAGTTAILSGDFFALVGTNFRTAVIEMNATDAWGAPSVQVGLNATVWTGAITSPKGGGYFSVDGSPWVAHQWQSIVGRRWYLEAGGSIYEITDNGAGTLEVDGADFTAVSGTVRIFGDRMAALLPTPARHRFLRISLSAQQTSDDAYIVGTLVVGEANRLTTPFALGYVTEEADPAQVFETDMGYRTASARGASPWSIRIAWDPVDETSTRVLLGLASLYRSLRGACEPMVFVPDIDDPNDLEIVRIFGPFVTENIIGHRRDQLARVAQLILRREL